MIHPVVPSNPCEGGKKKSLAKAVPLLTSPFKHVQYLAGAFPPWLPSPLNQPAQEHKATQGSPSPTPRLQPLSETDSIKFGEKASMTRLSCSCSLYRGFSCSLSFRAQSSPEQEDLSCPVFPEALQFNTDYSSYTAV